MPYKAKKKKANDEMISTSVLSYESRQVEKQRNDAEAEKLKYNNKKVKFIKQGITGKH